MPILTDNSFALGYELEIRGVLYRQVWRGKDAVPIDRVRALAFTDNGSLLLVGGDFGLQLPGGGVEIGETALQALHRELWEEAAARIIRVRRIGAVQIDILDDGQREFHDFFCCQISLEDDWVPTEEISERVTVPSNEFLDTLHWGWSDPKAAFLLERAMRIVSRL
jgi:8-oxo-dGTP pyrophosphatase MutT (NUDIX family)